MVSRSIRTAGVIALCVACLLGDTGCSFFVPHTYPVTVHSSDPEAEILVNGEVVGTGRATVRVPRNQSNDFAARLGERKKHRVIRDRISTTGILDAIGGFMILIPFVGLLAPGAWRPIEDNIYLELPDSSAPSE